MIIMNNLATTDTFDLGEGVIKGSLAKWSAEEGWHDRDGVDLPSPMIVIGTQHVVQRFKDKKLVNTILPPLPDLDELNNAVPRDEWELDLNGKPRPPYALFHVAYLLNPIDASLYTCINASVGTGIAVDRLESRMKLMRHLRGANVNPVVTLGEAPMKTRFGMKTRPEFVIKDWRSFGPTTIEAQPQTPRLAPPTVPTPEPRTIDKYVEIVGRKVKPVSLAEELNDAVPDFG
jgi:hypothetical protein